MTQPELQALCELWQRRLRLQDWNITAMSVPPVLMDSDIDAGGFLPNRAYRTAVIRISQERASTTMPGKRLTIEFTLVHELIHTFLWTTPETAAMIEVAINAIAEALVVAYGGSVYEDVE